MKKILFSLIVTFPILLPFCSYANQVIAGIDWLSAEPEGYYSWQEASKWCEDQGYRLPYMSELIAVWNANGGQISPVGFQKDTFYC